MEHGERNIQQTNLQPQPGKKAAERNAFVECEKNKRKETGGRKTAEKGRNRKVRKELNDD